MSLHSFFCGCQLCQRFGAGALVALVLFVPMYIVCYVAECRSCLFSHSTRVLNANGVALARKLMLPFKILSLQNVFIDIAGSIGASSFLWISYFGCSMFYTVRTLALSVASDSGIAAAVAARAKKNVV